MALVVRNPLGPPGLLGDRWLTIRELDFDASYPAGGEPLTWRDLGFAARPDVVIALDKNGFSFEYDSANQKLLARCPGVVTGAAGAGTLDDFPLQGVGASATSVALTAGGTVRFGAQKEVADGANLSSLTGVVVLAFGKHVV